MSGSSRALRHSLVVAAAVVGIALVVPVEPALAFKRATFVVERGTEPSATHGPIAGQYAATPAAVPTPSGCGNDANTAPFQGTCDTVPVKIIPPPDLGPTEDYLVTLTISWRPEGYAHDPSGEVGDSPINDLDVYFYDNQQIAQEADPESTTYTRLGESTAFGGPETIKLFSPRLVDYNLVIINVTGPNLDYTVKAKMEVDGFESPFEDLGPTFGSRRTAAPGRDDATDNLVAPLDFSGEEGGSAPTRDDAPVGDFANVFTGADRALEEVPLLPDSDFTSLSGESEFESQLSAPTPFGGATRELTRIVRDASPVLVAFWLVVVPLVVLGALVFFVRRRSRTAFSIN